MTWKKIETCPYRQTVVLGCWNIDCWLYRTVGSKKDDGFIDEQWRPITTATHWHELSLCPDEEKHEYKWTTSGAIFDLENGTVEHFKRTSGGKDD